MRLLFATAALSALAGTAAAETYNGREVVVEDAAAVVTVIAEDRTNIDVSITPGARLPAPQVRQTAEGILIDGGLDNRIRNCSTNGDRMQVNVRNLGTVRSEDFTRIVVRTPRTLDVAFGGAVLATVGASNGGSVFANGCGNTRIGAASGDLRVDLNGSGDVRAERAGGALAANLNGSGSLSIEEAASNAALRLNGSGDLRLQRVGGDVDARLNGSGSVDVGAVGGDAHVALGGSGDVDVGAVTGSLTAELRGSGSVDVASAEGASADLTLTSSGSLRVRGGSVGQLSARNSGSGELRFGGAAQATRAMLSGSGDITIAEAGTVQQLRDSGSGSVNVGR